MPKYVRTHKFRDEPRVVVTTRAMAIAEIINAGGPERLSRKALEAGRG